MDEKTVQCCGNKIDFHLSDVRHSIYRKWLRTKKLKMKVFDKDSLRRGAGVNVQDDNGYTPLHHACLNGHKEIVRLLLSVDASPCVADKRGATALHLAAWKGESHIVAMLLAHKNPPVNVDQLTSDHDTALLLAAHFGYTDVVAQLMAKGADVTIRNIRDESALDLAAQHGRLETVQHLLRVMPQLVEPYKPSKCRGKVFTSTPLHRASKNGRKEVVQVLLAAGMDPNIHTCNGTPLHEAACFRKASVVRILLANGADINALDRRGMTVHDLLADYSEEATRKVRRVIREFENRSRITYESEEELPPFPVQDHSPTSYPMPNLVKAPETQENTNKIKSFVSSSSSSQLTKNQPQSFVKKLASKCLGLKARFNSAPNISNNSANDAEIDVKSKQPHNKSSTNTLLIGNSKFFKILSKKEELGEVDCTSEFDTISLDRLTTLNRDSVVNRSNRSCPGFKTSLPNISENNELSDSQESVSVSTDHDVVINTDIDCDKTNGKLVAVNEAINCSVSKPNSIEKKRISVTSSDSANLVNECYESYEFSDKETRPNPKSVPQPPPRPNALVRKTSNESTIYENVTLLNQQTRPTPAARTHLSLKAPLEEVEKKVLYENVLLLKDKNLPDVPVRSIVKLSNDIVDENASIVSRSSTMSSDSLIDESNLEDILLSQKSKSFKHGIHPEVIRKRNISIISQTSSNSSSSSNLTEASALENVDCSGEGNDKNIYLSMTGTLPSNKKPIQEKKVLFRHKTFTNIEVDRNSIKLRDLSIWNKDHLKDTLANYHIRGTGHCIYSGPSVSEFIYVFNRDTLYKDVPPFTKLPNNKRDSYFETAICFCKPRPPKHHKSAEDLLEMHPQEKITEDAVFIDVNALKQSREMKTTSFRCFCDSESCTFHSDKRDTGHLVVKFSAIKKSISTPDITLNNSSLTVRNSRLIKNKSVPSNLEEPYAVVSVEDIVARQNSSLQNQVTDLDSPEYVAMCPSTMTSTLSSVSSNQLYSLKDISEVMSLTSTSTTASQSRASDSNQIPLEKSASEHSANWSLHSCNSNVTIRSDTSFVTCFEEPEADSEDTLHSDDEVSDTDTIKSDISTAKRPWVHSDSFRFGSRDAKFDVDVIAEESKDSGSSRFESGIGDSDLMSSSGDEGEGVPGAGGDVSLVASLERGSGVDGGVRSGSGRRRWDETEGTSEGDALSVSSAASSCAPLHLAHHHDYNKVSPTPPKKPPRRNLSVSPTHANSPSSGYSYELRPHARSQDDLDDIQGAKHYLKHGRSVDQYVDGKLSYSEYEDNHNSPRIAPVPNPRPSLSLKNRSQPVAITAMYENVVIKEQNPRRKLRRNNFAPQYESTETRMNDNRVRKYSNQEKSSLESLLDDQSMNSPSDCERYYDGPRVEIPLSPSHYEQPPTPDHPPPSAKQAENSIHERIRPLSQLIMEVVEEIRIRKKSQGDLVNS